MNELLARLQQSFKNSPEFFVKLRKWMWTVASICTAVYAVHAVNPELTKIIPEKWMDYIILIAALTAGSAGTSHLPVKDATTPDPGPSKTT